MAYDKVVDSTVLNAGLTQIASAIRAKTGTGGTLTFPSGFVSAIEGLSGGGATEPYIEETYDANGQLIDAVMHGYTQIRSNAFAYCGGLVSVSGISAITSIGYSAFQNCTNLALTSLPAGLTSISNYTFQNCSNLALTSLPAGITSISSSAFRDCSNLALTSIPAGITSIGNYTFQNCIGLTTITFEGTPQSINSYAFSGCTNLTTINVPWAEGAVENAPWGATNATINYNYTPEG